MKKIALIVAIAFVLGCVVSAQVPNKIWFYVAGRENNVQFIYIEDKETGTRCYAITPTFNAAENMGAATHAGAAISCVKR
jgi:hypothetical protein